jgi:hypothetical protein
LVPARAVAQGAGEVERAQALFDRALALTNRGVYDGACPMLEESQRLDPALGTQFNLADCYEHTRREPAAYDLFALVAKEAHVVGKVVRERDSITRMKTLEGKVARLRFRGRSPAVRLQFDGHELAASTEGVTTTPGSHAIDLTADDREPWHQDVTLDAGVVLEVQLPELRSLPPPTPPVVVEAPALPPTPPPSAAPAQAPSVPPSRSEEPSGLGPARTTALVIGGAGVTGLGVGAVAGVLSLSAHDSASRICAAPSPCGDATARSQWTTATRDGNISTVGFVAGGVLLAAGAALWFLASPGRGTGVAWCTPGGCLLGSSF